MIIVVQNQGSTSFLNYHQYKKMDVRYDQNSGRGRIDLVDTTNKKTIIVNSDQQEVLDGIANAFVQSIEAGAEFFYVSDVVQQVLSLQEQAKQEAEEMAKDKEPDAEPEEQGQDTSGQKKLGPGDLKVYGDEVPLDAQVQQEPEPPKASEGQVQPSEESLVQPDLPEASGVEKTDMRMETKMTQLPGRDSNYN